MSMSEIQKKLKAPKGQKNSFGGYMYRSCEDIVEAAKPILAEYGYHLNMSDDVVGVGDRVYIKATCRVLEGEKVVAESTALAREAENKKGMDDSQITGTASSYARKYALNGLFAIDDTKDADTDAYRNQTSQAASSFTDKQKQYFDELVQKGSALELYCLKEKLVDGDGSSSGAQIWLDLCGSFPKGEKGRKAELIKTLVQSGADKFTDLLSELEQHIDNDDSAGIEEIMSELSGLEKKVVMKKLNPQAAEMLKAA